MTDQHYYPQTAGAAESAPDSRHSSTSTQSSASSGAATDAPNPSAAAVSKGALNGSRLTGDCGVANQGGGGGGGGVVVPQAREAEGEPKSGKAKLGDRLRALGHGGKLQ